MGGSGEVFVLEVGPCLQYLLEVFQTLIKAPPHTLPRPPRELLHHTRRLPPRFLLTMLKTLQRIRPLILRYNTQTLLHLEVDVVDLEDT